MIYTKQTIENIIKTTVAARPTNFGVPATAVEDFFKSNPNVAALTKAQVIDKVTALVSKHEATVGVK